MKILVLSMGGTIDAKAYPINEADYPKNATPSNKQRGYQVLKKLAKAHNITLEHTAICNKDSKSLNDDDRENLLKSIQSARADRILVTTGTDTMVQTAQWTKDHLSAVTCPIVFTGAIWPLANGKTKSDGFDNLELAALGFENLSPDIYVAMHSIMTTPDHIKKDVATRTFIRIDP